MPADALMHCASATPLSVDRQYVEQQSLQAKVTLSPGHTDYSDRYLAIRSGHLVALVSRVTSRRPESNVPARDVSKRETACGVTVRLRGLLACLAS